MQDISVEKLLEIQDINLIKKILKSYSKEKLQLVQKEYQYRKNYAADVLQKNKKLSNGEYMKVCATQRKYEKLISFIFSIINETNYFE